MTVAPRDKVEPLALSRKSSVLPGVAVRMLLGARSAPKEDGTVRLEFSNSVESDALILHEEDFEISRKVASRLSTACPSRKITPLTLIGMMELGAKFVAEEIFTKGALRILYYPAMAEGSAFHRCVIPSLAINSRGKCVSYVTTEKSLRQAAEFDVVVFQLGFSEADRKFAEFLQNAGKRVVFEIDDAFDALESWHPGYEHFRKPSTQEAVKRMMAQADLVTVTTPYLADRYRPLCKRIEIIPNCLPLADWPKAEPNTDGTFRVLWAGSPAHFGDLSEIAEGLGAFAQAHSDVRLVFFGRRPVGLPDSLRVGNRVEFHDWVPFGEFPPKLADLKADVAIAPLEDIPFNHAKSNLRLIQYGATGYPVIASAVGEYKRTGVGLVTLCSEKNDWVDALELHRANIEFRNLMRDRSGELARQFDIGERAESIEKIYMELVGRE